MAEQQQLEMKDEMIPPSGLFQTKISKQQLQEETRQLAIENRNLQATIQREKKALEQLRRLINDLEKQKEKPNGWRSRRRN